MVILLVVAVDLIIILIGTTMPSSRLNATLVDDVQHPSSTDVSLLIINLSCIYNLHV